MKAVLTGLVLTSVLNISSPDYKQGYELAVSAVEQDAVIPDSNKCPNCVNGKVGDGKVFTDCLECGGDGILDLVNGESFVDAGACVACKAAGDRKQPVRAVARGTVRHARGLIKSRPVRSILRRRCK